MIELTNKQRANILKWVEALESGKYTQTTGVLRNNDGFCCLGVACDVLGVNCFLNPITGEYYYGPYHSYHSSLPIDTRKELCIADDDEVGMFPKPVTMPDGRIFDSLVDLNDEGCYDFKTIAKVIRQVWLGEK